MTGARTVSVKSYRTIGRSPLPPPNARALGRLKAGQMNKTEARYSVHLDQRRRDGEVLWWRFEGLKFRLADNTFYTPDFNVMLADGFIENHDVKGSRGMVEEDAKVKIKVAAEMYPYRFVLVFPKREGRWDLEAIS